MKIHRTSLPSLAVLALISLAAATSSFAAGVLTPKGSPDQPVRMTDHHVHVVLNNGFARTEVSQTFHNPNPHDLEAVYTFPLPKSASLSEVTLQLGEREIHGEVVEKQKARTIYEGEKQAGNDTGLAEKNGFQSFEFRVHPVPAQGEARLRLVYYQPLEIDTGVGRYLYPLEDGGTDEVAQAFWNPVSTALEGSFSAEIELKSAWPVASVRLPGFEQDAVTDKQGAGHYRVRLDRQGQALDKDLVFYYRLADDLPGRVEVIPYRKAGTAHGTFMMVVTPGIDLQPIRRGADYIFVLDTSGSMQGKLHTLIGGVSQTLGKMQDLDRFRIVTFSSHANEVTSGWQPATRGNVEAMLEKLRALQAGGSTNLYDGLSLALQDLDDDRATSVVLVTDGVTNTGILEGAEFHKLARRHDIRIFGFLLGNSGNWPVMRTVCEASGGFYAGVSNADDIVGQILQAKGKVLHECLHDVELKFGGVKTFDVNGRLPGKVYRGQQLVMFGRYAGGGEATLELKARLTGEDKTYRTTFHLPEEDVSSPEIERLWALDQIELLEWKAFTGEVPSGESDTAIRDLGLQYQLVTDQTSMLVMSDDAFNRHGIERRNQARVASERAAQTLRSTAPEPVDRRVDSAAPLTPSRAPSLFSGGGGSGGGAFSPWSVLLMLAFSLASQRVRFGKRA